MPPQHGKAKSPGCWGHAAVAVPDLRGGPSTSRPRTAGLLRAFITKDNTNEVIKGHGRDRRLLGTVNDGAVEV